MFSKAAIAQGFPLSDIAHLRCYAEELKAGGFGVGAPTDHVREVSGVSPEDFETIARRYIRAPSLIHPALKVGSKLAALGFLARMLATKPADLDAWERDRGYPLLRDSVLSQDSAEWRESAERQQLNILPNLQGHSPIHEQVA
jgi:hypothetical protein